MVTGPNGSGKSSLFRIIGELWPLHNGNVLIILYASNVIISIDWIPNYTLCYISAGNVIKPPKMDFLFVPQKPYQVLGTLRDQIIYPHSVAQMQQQGI